MAVMNGTKINVVANNISELVVINPEKEVGLVKSIRLSDSNVFQLQNDVKLKNVFEYYDLYRFFV